MREVDWYRLLELIDSRKSRFEGLLPQATRIVEEFFLRQSVSQSLEIDMSLRRPNFLNEAKDTSHERTPESTMICQRSVDQVEVLNQNTVESTPAPAVRSADLVSPNFTCSTEKRGILSPSAATLAVAPIQNRQSSIEVGDCDSSGLRNTIITKLPGPATAEVGASNRSISSPASDHGSLDSALFWGEATRIVLPTPDWDHGF
jgi:hypothetical protein